MEDKNSIQKNKKNNFVCVTILIILIIIVLLLILIWYELHQKNDEEEQVNDNTNVSVTEKNEEDDETALVTNMQVFINEKLSDKEVQQFREKISKIDGVASATVYTKEDALNEMKIKLKDNKDVLDEFEGDNNIFPDSIIVQLDGQVSAEKIKRIIENIKINGKDCTDEITLQKY